MKLRFAKLAAAAALTGLIAGCNANANQGSTVAQAEGAHPRTEHRFARFDADGDGRITREEVKARAAERFAEMDANGDGQISGDEHRAFHQARQAEHQQRRFSRMDANGDGGVSLEELKTHMAERMAERAERRFAKLDSDGNGTLSLAEMQAGKGRHGGKGHRGQGHGGKGKRMGEHGGKGYGQHGGKRHGGQRAEAGHGPMTLQDLDARMMRMFDRADVNKDGVITLDEAGKLGRHGRRG